MKENVVGENILKRFFPYKVWKNPFGIGHTKYDRV